MRFVVVLALLSACSSKAKDPEPGSATEPKGSATEPKGSATEPKGSATGSATEPKGSDASGSGSATEPKGSDAGSAAGSGSAVAFVFDKLTRQEKLDFMKKQVVPTMKPLFQKFDAKKYANFGCKTCHGKDPQGAKYKMPNGDIPKLDFKALEAGKQEPKIAKWMGEVVKPEMAKLLQLPEMTQTNHTGFGCLACHEQKK